MTYLSRTLKIFFINTILTKKFQHLLCFKFLTDLDENPTSEECCGPEGVAKYEGKNEAEEESLTKISTDLVGEDLIRLESKPKVNEQERGGSSRKEEFFPGNKHRRQYYYNSFFC